VGRASGEFQTFLAPLAHLPITYDDAVPNDYIDPTLAARSKLLGSVHLRWKYLGDLRDAVRRCRPDYVLVPSGDYQSRPTGLVRLLGRASLPGGVPGEAGFHYGHGRSAARFGERVREAAIRLAQRASPWKKLHLINCLVHEDIEAHAPSLARRCVVSPHPVPPGRRAEKRECRRRLGLPEDGRAIGLAALIDERKAVREFLAAFRAGAPRPDDRLILAGRISPEFQPVVHRDNADLIAQGRLIVLDRFLDIPTFELVFGALDVICLPYPKHVQLSSALLYGVAAGLPVLVNNNPGWSRALVRRFEFGWECDVTDPGSFAAAIRQAFEECERYVESEATRRLLAFHDPANFIDTWLAGIRERRGRPPSESLKTWPWVLEALDPDRRTRL
jgi:glycosyltransferase involved in cell wall biosynthesis